MKQQSWSPCLGSPVVMSLPSLGTINNFKYTLTGPKFTGGSRESKCHLLPSLGTTRVTMGPFLLLDSLPRHCHHCESVEIPQGGFRGFFN